jgi:hypothetical protein
MKKLFPFLVALVTALNLHAQASWNAKCAFILRDEHDQPVNPELFRESYTLINIFGDTVPETRLDQYLTYDEKTHYFVADIETIGHRFSFCLLHNNEAMIIYLPFINPTDIYYAVDFTFKKGSFLFDFELKNEEKIYVKSNVPYYIIEKIHWGKQSRKLKQSDYAADQTYSKYIN